MLDENPDYKGVYWSPEDNPGFCKCESCQALDTGVVYQPDRPPLPVLDPLSGTSMTDRVFKFGNALATELEKTHPDKLVVVLAYWHYVEPPRELRLHRNVVVWYTVSCIGHWNEARRELDFDRLQRWIRAANDDPGKLMIYEYYINGAWPDLYRLFMPLIDESIKRLYMEGVRLYYTQTMHDSGINGLNYYVASRLLWDSGLDLDDLMQDFYAKSFGRGATGMERFFTRLTEAWRQNTQPDKYTNSAFAGAGAAARPVDRVLSQGSDGRLQARSGRGGGCSG